MLVLFCSHQNTYRFIKKSLKLTEYPAHDISVLEYFAIPKPFPVAISLDKDSNVLLISLVSHPINFQNIILGAVYMSIPTSTIIYIDSIPTMEQTADTQTNYSMALPLSVHTSTTNTDKTLRPIFFDIIIKVPEGVQEMPRYTNDEAHFLLSMAAKLWESHHLYTLLLLHTTNANSDYVFSQHTHLVLSHILFSLMHIPQCNILPSQMIQWLLSAKKTWKLSSTQFCQLETLLEGYFQQKQYMLPHNIIELLNEPIYNPADISKKFLHAKTLLLQALS